MNKLFLLVIAALLLAGLLSCASQRDRAQGQITDARVCPEALQPERICKALLDYVFRDVPLACPPEPFTLHAPHPEMKFVRGVLRRERADSIYVFWLMRHDASLGPLRWEYAVDTGDLLLLSDSERKRLRKVKLPWSRVARFAVIDQGPDHVKIDFILSPAMTQVTLRDNQGILEVVGDLTWDE